MCRRSRKSRRTSPIQTLGVALGVALMPWTVRGHAPTTGIAQCDEFYAAVAGCLPQMCESERALVEADLSFHHEILLKTIELKGRAAGAESCAKDLLDEFQQDPYGCYESQRAKAGLPKASIQDVRIRPTASSVSIAFKLAPETSSAGRPQVAIVSEDLQNELQYLPTASNGVFSLDTAVDRPASSGESGGAVALEPERSYCFAIKSADGQERRGTFTTAAASR